MEAPLVGGMDEMRVLDQLANPSYLIDVGVPLLAVMLSVYARCVSRNDQHKSISSEDFAVGLDLSIAALLILIVSCGADAERAMRLTPGIGVVSCATRFPWIVLAMAFAIWALSTFIRK